MATYRITGPDGASYQVTAPDDADQGQVLSYFRQNVGGGAPAPARKPSGPDLAYRDALKRDKGSHAGGFERAVAQGALFNYADELDAKTAAAMTAANNGWRKITGRPSVGYTSREAYDAVARVNREQEEAYRRDHAGGDLAGQLLGGLAPGGLALKGAKLLHGLATGGRVAEAARAATLAQRVRTGAGVGGAAGAAYGSGGATEGHRAQGAAGGAVAGAVMGGAAPVVLAGGGRLLSPVVDPLLERGRPVLAAARAAVSQGRGARVEDRARAAGQALAQTQAERLSRPEQRAAIAIQRALERDQRSGHEPRPDAPLYLGGGENVATLAELVAQFPGAGKGIMSDAAEESLARNVAGFKGDLEQHLGGRGGYLEHLADLKGERAAAGKAALDDAFSDPLDADRYNEQFGGLVGRLPRGTWGTAADLARMEGRDPYELGLVRADTFEGHPVGGRSAADVSGLDLAALRRGVQGGEASRGDTLAAYLAKRGGLRDDGGDLTGMGAHLWHRGKPFAPRLLREDGRPLDDAARLAREGGFFPEALGDAVDTHHPVSPDELMAALREELAGRPRYAQHPEAPGRRAQLDDLEGRLNAAGIDPHSVSPEEASRLLGDDADFADLAEAHLHGDAPGMSLDELLSVETPTLRAAHLVKKALDAKLTPHRNQVSGRLDLEGNPEAAAIAKLRSEWGAAMRKASPKYNHAMGEWGDDSEAIDGLELGRNALSEGHAWSAEAVGLRHRELSEEARRQYQRGVGEAILHKARTKGGLSAMRQLLRNEDMADKVRLAFPTPESFEGFLATTRQRVADEGRNTRILHNSRTYGRQAAEEDLAEEPGADVLGTLMDVGGGNVRGLLQRAAKALPRRDRGVLSDAQANPLLAEALTDPATAQRVRRLLALKQARSLRARAAGQTSRAALLAAEAGNRQ